MPVISLKPPDETSENFYRKQQEVSACFPLLVRNDTLECNSHPKATKPGKSRERIQPRLISKTRFSKDASTEFSLGLQELDTQSTGAMIQGNQSFINRPRHRRTFSVEPYQQRFFSS